MLEEQADYPRVLGKGKSHLEQDPAWVQLKLAGKVHRKRPSALALPVETYPRAFTLDTSHVDTISEPPSPGIDAAGHSYVDNYMWYLCGPGATNVAMDYWSTVNNRNVGGHSYSDPFTTTFWDDTNFRAYTMYIATQVYPPSFNVPGGGPGEVSYGQYPYAGTALSDLRDTMNWEASGHDASNWANFFYLLVDAGSLTLSNLQTYVMSDTSYEGVPLIVCVNDRYLPDWNNSSAKGHAHLVAVVGYDNNQGTFTYIETCPPVSCGTSGTGQFTVSQQQLFNGIQDNSGIGGVIW